MTMNPYASTPEEKAARAQSIADLEQSIREQQEQMTPAGWEWLRKWRPREFSETRQEAVDTEPDLTRGID